MRRFRILFLLFSCSPVESKVKVGAQLVYADLDGRRKDNCSAAKQEEEVDAATAVSPSEVLGHGCCCPWC